MQPFMEKATMLLKNLLFRFVSVAASLLFTAIVLLNASQSMATTDKDTNKDVAPGRKIAQQTTLEKKRWITTDHSKHQILKQKFTSGPQVTKACLSCHSEAAIQFHKTIHWTWMDPATTDGKQLGKGGLSVNNF